MIIITIDGPSASGKSTVAQSIAQALDLYYINTGFLYRALALNAFHHAIVLKDFSALDTQQIQMLFATIGYYYDSAQNKIIVTLDSHDCTNQLKTSLIDAAASLISVNATVRTTMDNYVRERADEHNCILDGRDCGSVIFPNATVKFYLTAELETRARRWLADQKLKNNIFTLDQALKAIADRDERDTGRKDNPLTIPDGAIIVDNSFMSLEQTIEYMIVQINETIAQKKEA